MMRAGIDSPGQTANDYQPSGGKIPAQPLSHLIPIRGRTTRPDDRNRMAIQKFNVSAYIQEGRRIEDLSKPRRILRFIPSKHLAAILFGLSNFLRRGA